MFFEDMSLRRVAVGRQRQLVAKLNINNQVRWLYRVQPLRSVGHSADYYLLDANGEIEQEWPNADLADIKTEIRKMTTHQVNEDHFAPEQVEQIKACQDSAVQSFYKQYLRAEALGDREAADRLSAAIIRRCGLLGVFSTTPTAESEESPAANNEYQQWEARMKAAGAVVFKTDNTENPTVVRAYKIVGSKHVELGEFDLIDNKEMFESSQLMMKYTVEGLEVDLEMWTEQVLAEGATEIRNFSGGKVAYLGESRIGIFRNKEETPVKKNFNDILKESYTVNMNIGTADSGEVVNSVTVTADGNDASQLLSILKLSGLSSANTRDEECCSGGFEAEVTEEYANAPDEKYASTDTQLNKMSGGLNKQKRMSNPNNPADNPLAMGKLGVKHGKQLNIEEAKLAESLESEFANFAIRVDESVDDRIRAIRAQINKLKAQQAAGSPNGDVSKKIKTAVADLAKLKKQKQLGIDFGGKQLDELAPDTYRNYIDTATGDYAHTNTQRLRTPRDQQKPFLDRMEKRNAGLARAQSGLDRYASDVVHEDVEAEGNIGDEVIITGNVQYRGKTGVIADFGQGRRFVIVDLYNYGKHSFHASDVSINDYADSSEEQDDMYDRDEDFRDWESDRD